MPEFIKDLVELRKSQDISLEDIYERTKISISSLQSIEQGNFNDLPVTYVRLFLKAYVTEIGGESIKALKDLDVYLAPNHTQTSGVTATSGAEKFDGCHGV